MLLSLRVIEVWKLANKLHFDFAKFMLEKYGDACCYPCSSWDRSVPSLWKH